MSGPHKSLFNYFIGKGDWWKEERKGAFSYFGRMRHYLPLRRGEQLPGLQALLNYDVRCSGAGGLPFPTATPPAARPPRRLRGAWAQPPFR